MTRVLIAAIIVGLVIAGIRVYKPRKDVGFPASRRAAARNKRRNERMKRSETLTEIQWAGWHGNVENASTLTRQKNIGSASSMRAFRKGQKMKERGEPCGCAACAKKASKA